MLLKLRDLVLIKVVRRLGVLAGYSEDMAKGRLDVITPEVKQTAGSVTGRPSHYPIQEIISSPEAQLKAASGERAVVNIEIGITVLKLRFLGVAGNPYGKSASGMYDFLGDIGAEPAKYLLSLAPVLQNMGRLGKGVVDLSKSVKRIQFSTISLWRISHVKQQ